MDLVLLDCGRELWIWGGLVFDFLGVLGYFLVEASVLVAFGLDLLGGVLDFGLELLVYWHYTGYFVIYLGHLLFVSDCLSRC